MSRFIGFDPIRCVTVLGMSGPGKVDLSGYNYGAISSLVLVADRDNLALQVPSSCQEPDGTTITDQPEPQHSGCAYANVSVPRWKSAITESIAQNKKSIVLQLATVTETEPGIVVPRVRSVIFRGFLSPASAPALPLILVTSDVRASKAHQIVANPNVELVWWVEGAQEQFRIVGHAFIVPTPGHVYATHFAQVRASAALAALEKEGFDWECKRRELFDAMSAQMKASWCTPMPGSVLEGGYESARSWRGSLPKLGAGSGEADEERDLEMALGNFVLVVIDPVEVDHLELGVAPIRRTRFRVNERGEWSEVVVVP